MPRRQILSSEEQARLLVIPDDEIILTRMCFLCDKDIGVLRRNRRNFRPVIFSGPSVLQ